MKVQGHIPVNEVNIENQEGMAYEDDPGEEVEVEE